LWVNINFFKNFLSLHFILCFRNKQANVHVNLDWNIALSNYGICATERHKHDIYIIVKTVNYDFGAIEVGNCGIWAVATGNDDI